MSARTGLTPNDRSAPQLRAGATHAIQNTRADHAYALRLQRNSSYPSGGIRPSLETAEFAAKCFALAFFGLFALALIFGPQIAAAIILLFG